VTSPCTEPDRPDHFRTNPRLLQRRVPHATVVCVAAESAYQDVRVLRLDALAAAVIDAARVAQPRDALAVTVAGTLGEPVDAVDALIDGLLAARVLEQSMP
jgi:hypothetical protein